PCTAGGRHWPEPTSAPCPTPSSPPWSSTRSPTWASRSSSRTGRRPRRRWAPRRPGDRTGSALRPAEAVRVLRDDPARQGVGEAQDVLVDAVVVLHVLRPLAGEAVQRLL